MAVIPALGSRSLADPIALLMGGPGEDAISAAEDIARRAAALRHDRDILLVDQRGTGRSADLSCPLFSSNHPEASLRDLFPPAAVQRCARALSARADLTQYTYERFANDLEDVRRALGYGPLNLSAGSYGTRAAQVYMRMYPKSVRTAFLESVVDIDIPSPLPLAQAEEAALDKLFAACAADAACHNAFPRLQDEFHEMAARLASGAVRVTIPGRADAAQLYLGRIAEWFRSRLYRPYSSTALPWMIHQAYQGSWSPIVEGILSDAGEADSGLSFGLFFSITCSEDVAFLEEPDVRAQTQGTFLGDYRIRQQQRACRYWPHASLPKGFRELVQSSVPTLFASGDTDSATPLWSTERVAQGFSHRREVVLPGQGHTEWNDCLEQLYTQLVTTGSEAPGGKSSCPPVPRPAFKTR